MLVGIVEDWKIKIKNRVLLLMSRAFRNLFVDDLRGCNIKYNTMIDNDLYINYCTVELHSNLFKYLSTCHCNKFNITAIEEVEM